VTITEFISARLDEDEAVAREVQEKVAPNAEGRVDYWEDASGSAASIIWDVDYLQGGYTVTAARVLAEVEAKRRMMELHDHCDDWAYGDPSTCPELRLLALPYADHPDYREEWRP
jgi:hypothetical protein